MDKLMVRLYNEIAKIFDYNPRFEITFSFRPARDSLGDRGFITYTVNDKKTGWSRSWSVVPSELTLSHIDPISEGLQLMKEDFEKGEHNVIT